MYEEQYLNVTCRSLSCHEGILWPGMQATHGSSHSVQGSGPPCNQLWKVIFLKRNKEFHKKTQWGEDGQGSHHAKQPNQCISCHLDGRSPCLRTKQNAEEDKGNTSDGKEGPLSWVTLQRDKMDANIKSTGYHALKCVGRVAMSKIWELLDVPELDGHGEVLFMKCWTKSVWSSGQ